MHNTKTIIKENSRVEANVSTELNKVGATAIAFSAAAVGCWATACLFAGTISSGGPIGLLSTLVTTITG